MPINRTNKRTGQKEWYGKVTHNGQTYTKKAPTKRDALKWERATRAELESQRSTGTVYLSTLFNAYLDNVQARFGASSYKDKARVFREAMQRFGDTPVKALSYKDLEKWLSKVKVDVSGITANRYKVHMVAAYNWGIKALDLPEPNPWRVQKFKEEGGEKYVPPISDFSRVLDCGDGAEKAMLLSFLHLAARKSEVLCLEWKDVDLDKRRVRIWTRKRDGGREADFVPMSDDLFMALREQRFRTGLSQWVFPNPDTGTPYTWHGKFLPRLCKAAGVKEFGYHSLRHLAACLLDEAGEPLAFIQAMLRHKNATTTSRYLHSLQGIRAPKMGAFEQKGARSGAQTLEDDAQMTATR